MPKIISRGTSVSSGRDTTFTDQTVQIYYCVCNAHCLSLDTPLEKLPQRRTDGAYVLIKADHQYSLKVMKLGSVVLKRDQGYERQWRYGCTQCQLPICYLSKEDVDDITYLMQGSLHRHEYQKPGGGADPVKAFMSQLSPEEEKYFAQMDEKEQEKEKEQEQQKQQQGAAKEKPALSAKEQARLLRERIRKLEARGGKKNEQKKTEQEKGKAKEEDGDGETSRKRDRTSEEQEAKRDDYSKGKKAKEREEGATNVQSPSHKHREGKEEEGEGEEEKEKLPQSKRAKPNEAQKKED
ncbi:Nipped-B-like protein B [Balamuthia mandrillaris]